MRNRLIQLENFSDGGNQAEAVMRQNCRAPADFAELFTRH
jgi:hypothetical protein